MCLFPTESRRSSVDVFLKAAGYLDCVVRHVLPQMPNELRYLFDRFCNDYLLQLLFWSLAHRDTSEVGTSPEAGSLSTNFIIVFLDTDGVIGIGIAATAVGLLAGGIAAALSARKNGNLKDEPGAIVCRVAQSFLRFDDLALIHTLADYAIRHHFPHLENIRDDSVVDLTSNKYAAWAVEVVERTAFLVAHWQGVGFTNGVLNTDNMSVLGLTIDYGPFGLFDAFDPGFTPNTTDLPRRRYCFANQSDVGLWNIAQFATILSSAKLINDKEANYAMKRYGTKFMDEYEGLMTKKIALPKYNKQLISEVLKNMAVDKVDYTNFFRLLSKIKAEPTIPEDELLNPLKAVLLDIGKERKDAWTNWVKSYLQEVFICFSFCFFFTLRCYIWCLLSCVTEKKM
ncbi:hypothetical protein ACJIZ3_007385 [Penstemon smallii]|uniref:Selenoprotein O n=1 Tax=Penstemon smallii TaxID=265156 RepID=A0ABD3SAE3_9LAMI